MQLIISNLISLVVGVILGFIVGRRFNLEMKAVIAGVIITLAVVVIIAPIVVDGYEAPWWVGSSFLTLVAGFYGSEIITKNFINKK